MHRAVLDVKGGSKKLLLNTRVKNNNYFPLKQGQTNSIENQKGWALRSWKKAAGAGAISLVDEGDMIQEPPLEGWYTTDRPASWKRPLAIRNSSLAPTFR